MALLEELFETNVKAVSMSWPEIVAYLCLLGFWHCKKKQVETDIHVIS